MLSRASFISLRMDAWNRRPQFMQTVTSKIHVLEFCPFHFTRGTFSFMLASEMRTNPIPIFRQVPKLFLSTNFSLRLLPQAQILLFSLSSTFIPKKGDAIGFNLKSHPPPNTSLHPFHTLFLFLLRTKLRSILSVRSTADPTSRFLPGYLTKQTLSAGPLSSLFFLFLFTALSFFPSHPRSYHRKSQFFM